MTDDVQQRAAEVRQVVRAAIVEELTRVRINGSVRIAYDSDVAGMPEQDAQMIATFTAGGVIAALAAANLLVDDDTARRVKLGRAVELMREAMLRDTGRVDAGYRVCLDAIYREAERQP